MDKVFRWKERGRRTSPVYSCISDAGASWGKVLEQMTRSADRAGSWVLRGILLRWVRAKSEHEAAAWLGANQCNRRLMILLLGFVRLPQVTQKGRIKNWETCTWSEPLYTRIYSSPLQVSSVFLSCSRAGLKPNHGQSVHLFWYTVQFSGQVHHRLLRGPLRGGPNSSSGRVLAILADGRPTTWYSSHWEFWELAEMLWNPGVQTALEIQAITWILDTRRFGRKFASAFSWETMSIAFCILKRFKRVL